MNFKRIQSIFIIAFVALDLVLLASYLWGSRFIAETIQSQSQQTTILREMKADSISLPSLTTTRASGYYMTATMDTNLVNTANALRGANAREVNDLVTVTFTKPVKVSAKVKKADLATWLTNHRRLLYGDEYTYLPSQSTKHHLVFAQKMAGRPVLEEAGQLRIKINSAGDVVSYTQARLRDIQVLRQRQATISQLTAVTWLYKNNQIENDTKVKWAQLGYVEQTTSGNEQVYVPAWVVAEKVTTSTTTNYLRVNAFSSTLIKE